MSNRSQFSIGIINLGFRMKNVISFCLWGNNLKYTLGAIKNCDLADKYFPGWICRFYIGEDIPHPIVDQLRERGNVELIHMSGPCDRTAMFWRFLAASDPEVNAMLSRDTDSRLCAREAAAVNEWMESNKDFHIIRDHPYHATEIMGGIWGVRNGLLSNMKNMVEDYKKVNFWQVDQNFLKEKIYPLVHTHALVHDPFFEKKPFPVERNYNSSVRFIGEVFDEHEQFNSDDITVLKQAEIEYRKYKAPFCVLGKAF